MLEFPISVELACGCHVYYSRGNPPPAAQIICNQCGDIYNVKFITRIDLDG